MAVDDPDLDTEYNKMHISIRMSLADGAMSDFEDTDSEHSTRQHVPSDSDEEIQDTASPKDANMTDLESHPPVLTRLVKRKGRKGEEKRPASVPETTSDTSSKVLDFDTILADRVRIQSGVDPVPTVRTRLHEEAERAIVQQHEHKNIYANPGGHSLFDFMNQINEKVGKLETELSEHRTKLSTHEALQTGVSDLRTEISHQRKQIHDLAKSSKKALAIRRRFLEVHRRTTRPNDYQQDMITRGNEVAHHGDVTLDATLYVNEPRTDPDIFQELYGLEYYEVIDFYDMVEDDGGLFLVLNAHATWLAKPAVHSPEVKAAFNIFLAEVRANWLQPPKRQPVGHPLRQAYQDFWKSHRQQEEAARVRARARA